MLKHVENTNFEMRFHVGNHLVQFDRSSIKVWFVPRRLPFSKVGCKTVWANRNKVLLHPWRRDQKRWKGKLTFSRDLSDSQVFILRTLWRRKWGKPARRDFLDEVSQPNNLAYRQRWKWFIKKIKTFLGFNQADPCQFKSTSMVLRTINFHCSRTRA